MSKKNWTQKDWEAHASAAGVKHDPNAQSWKKFIDFLKRTLGGK